MPKAENISFYFVKILTTLTYVCNEHTRLMSRTYLLRASHFSVN